MQLAACLSSCVMAALLAACSGGGDGGGAQPPDAAPDAFASDCGRPGDVGNELGIGKFCASLGDCSTPSAPLCSTLGDPDTHFCTRTCLATGPATQCGTGAQCTCDASNRCGCTPTTCL
jgi:hypothetical protein